MTVDPQQATCLDYELRSRSKSRIVELIVLVALVC
jgi:hypothetical protein